MTETVLRALVILSGLLFILFVFMALKSQKGQAPGLEGDRLTGCGTAPNCMCSELGTDSQHYAEPLPGNLADAVKAIVETGGTITSESDSYVSATYMSKLFKFVDDVELRQSKNGPVHIRSASRVGYSDRGVNKARIAAIRAAMNGGAENERLEREAGK